jgi:hypothetical protein
MKIILRDSVTGLYCGGSQTWCASVLEAKNFDSFQTAASVALVDKLETVNVVLRYEEPACELVLPLGLYRALSPVRMERR